MKALQFSYQYLSIATHYYLPGLSNAQRSLAERIFALITEHKRFGSNERMPKLLCSEGNETCDGPPEINWSKYIEIQLFLKTHPQLDSVSSIKHFCGTLNEGWICHECLGDIFWDVGFSKMKMILDCSWVSMKNSFADEFLEESQLTLIFSARQVSQQ